MFTDLRKKSSSLIVTLMFSIIIITFAISFGPGSRGGCSTAEKNAVRVNGDIVSEAEFSYEYNKMYDYYARIIPNFNEKTARQQHLGQRTMDKVIGNLLLYQKADDLGFRVSDAEIAKVIRENPAFHKNGAFDMEQYRRAVQFEMNASVKQFEERVKRQLMARKLITFFYSSTGAANTEVKDEYFNTHDTLNAEFVLFSAGKLRSEARKKLSDAIKDSDVNAFLKKEEKRVKEYYDTHGDEFATTDKNGATVKKEFSAVRSDIARNMMVDEKVLDLVEQAAQKLSADAETGTKITADYLAKTFADWDVSIQPLKDIRKNAFYLPGIGMNRKLVEKMFAVRRIPTWLPEPVGTDGDAFAVVRVVEHPPVDMQKFAQDKPALARRLSVLKAGQLLQDYIEELKQHASVKVNQEFMQRYSDKEAQ